MALERISPTWLSSFKPVSPARPVPSSLIMFSRCYCQSLFVSCLFVPVHASSRAGSERHRVQVVWIDKSFSSDVHGVYDVFKMLDGSVTPEGNSGVSEDSQ